jgi:hypothetical protein
MPEYAISTTEAKLAWPIVRVKARMLNMTMMSRAARKRAHVVKLNEPVLQEETKNESDMAK